VVTRLRCGPTGAVTTATDKPRRCSYRDSHCPNTRGSSPSLCGKLGQYPSTPIYSAVWTA
jgi:hypothetical protein